MSDATPMSNAEPPSLFGSEPEPEPESDATAPEVGVQAGNGQGRRRRWQRRAASVPGAGAGDPVVEALGRIEGLLKVLTRVALRTALKEELKDDSAKAIYDATGEHTSREIAALAGVGVATVSRTWARWEAMGLLVKDGIRYRRAF